MASLSDVDKIILKQIDRLAVGCTNAEDAFVGGTSFWNLVDSAQNADYENIVKGIEMTNLDTSLNAMTSIDIFEWIRLHETYFTSKLGIELIPYFNTWLSVRKVRVPIKFADTYLESKGNTVYSISPENIFTKGIYVDGNPTNSKMHHFGTVTDTTYVEVDGDLDLLVNGVAPIVAINMNDAQTSECIVNCIHRPDANDGISYDDVSVPITVNFTASNQYSNVIVGAYEYTGTINSGTETLNLTDTGNFCVGQKVMLYQPDNLLSEICTIESIETDISITLSSETLNTFETSCVIIPLFVGITFTSATGSGATRFYALPDRELSL